MVQVNEIGWKTFGNTADFNIAGQCDIRSWDKTNMAYGAHNLTAAAKRLFGSECDCNVTDVHIIYDKHKDPDTGKKIKGGPKGVIVYFADGTKEKAICEDGDIPLFNLDFGITICLCKKLMGGSKAYNSKIADIRDMMVEKTVKKFRDREQKRLEGEARQEVKRAVAEAKHAAREAEIEIQKEAYLRAMREYSKDASLPDHG